MLEVSSGANYTQRSQGFNTGIIVTLDSKEAEAAYQTHPIHVEVRDTIIKPLLTGLSLHALGPDKRLLASHICALCAGEKPLLALDYLHEQPVCPIDWRSFLAIGLAIGFVLGAFARR